MKAIVLSAKSPIHRPSLRRGFLLILLVLVCFGLAPMAQAVGPDTDGNIPGSNNGEGIGVLVSRTGGIWNTGTGFAALNHLTAGNQNTATGVRALNSDINGGFNTATGVYSLFSNTSGFFNCATGAYSLANNTTGGNNTANGYGALYSNTEGINNTANGFAALYRNTTDSFNTAIGVQALFSNTGMGGHYNVATGYQALYSNITGRRNVANGSTALFSNTTGIANTAQGDQALYSNATGSFNTAIGFGALYSSTNCGDPGCTGGGNGNTAIGDSALVNFTTGGGNTAIGDSALVNHITGNQNIVLGYVAGQNLTDGCCNIYISNPGVAAEQTTIRIGNVVPFTDIYGFGHPAHTATYIAGISGTAVVGDTVVVDANGQLGTVASSARFKKKIKPMDDASEAILALKPVSFRYKSDSKGTPQFGLIAEEVAKVNPDLVVRDRNGEIYSVRYEAVNAMLLNEFLKEHQTVQEQQREIDLLRAELKEQRALIQKVSAKVELDKPAPQTVLNDQ